MSYKRTTWERGMIIASALLNNMEEGIVQGLNDAAAISASKHQVNGIAALDSNGRLYGDQIPNNSVSVTNGSYFLTGVSQSNGSWSRTQDTFSPAVGITNGTSSDGPKINIMVAGNTSASQELNKATTSIYGVTALSNTRSSESSLAATPKCVDDAINALDINTITNTAGKTISTITETDGKVGATFQDISILSSQISDKGSANCVATLDANGHVPASQLPSFVDDILEYNGVSNFPAAANAEAGKIYVDTSTNTSYRWSGSQYTKVASDLSLGETSATAYAGDKGKEAHDWAADAYAHGITNKGSAFSSNLYKITTNNEGHVTAATAATGSDIAGLVPYTFTSGTNAFTVTPAGGSAQTVSITPSIAVATSSTDGLMSSTHYSKLEALPENANYYELPETPEVTSIKIGNTILTEETLLALIALLPPVEEPDPEEPNNGEEP